MYPPSSRSPRRRGRVIGIAAAVVVLVIAAAAAWWFVFRPAAPDSAGDFGQTTTRNGQPILRDDEQRPEEQRWFEVPYAYEDHVTERLPIVRPIDDRHALISPGKVIEGLPRIVPGTDVSVRLVDLSSGEVSWTLAAGEHCTGQECAISADDLPGTEFVAVRWDGAAEQGTPSWRIALVRRSTGELVSALSGDGFVRLASTSGGNLYLMRFAGHDGDERPRTISRIADDLTRPVWETDALADTRYDNFDPFPFEMDGVVYLGRGNEHATALRIDDGTPFDLPGVERGTPFLRVRDVVLARNEANETIARGMDGQELWRHPQRYSYFACNDRLYRGEVDPTRVAIIDLSTGEVEHEADSPNPIYQHWCLGEWIISLDYTPAVLDGSTGELLWQLDGWRLAGVGHTEMMDLALAPV